MEGRLKIKEREIIYKNTGGGDRLEEEVEMGKRPRIIEVGKKIKKKRLLLDVMLESENLNIKARKNIY